MTDKVQKIKDWISKEQDGLMDAQGNFENPCDEGAFHILTNLDYYIDSLQEVPCNHCQGFNDKEKCDELVFGHNCPVVKKPVNEDLEEASNNALDKISKKYDIVNIKSCLEMFRLGAEWQKNHLWKNAQGDDLPEIDREVIVLCENSYAAYGHSPYVAFGHRPNPDGWDGKSLATGEVEHYIPKTYDKGGWNIPDVKYWLDCQIPKIEED